MRIMPICDAGTLPVLAWLDLGKEAWHVKDNSSLQTPPSPSTSSSPAPLYPSESCPNYPIALLVIMLHVILSTHTQPSFSLVLALLSLF